MLSYPNVIKLAHCLFHDCRFISQDACFKVAFVVGLHANTSTREVRTTNIDLLTIKYKHLAS